MPPRATALVSTRRSCCAGVNPTYSFVVVVARRQKNQGIHWSEETSVALMRLRTPRLNGDWDR